MSNNRDKGKRRRCLQHREERYLHAINKVIDGKADPSYATYRWDKLKEVRR